jgi:hypothetical protein
MESVFSNQIEALMPNGAPFSPTITKVEFKNGDAQVTVKLPTTDADGSPLTGLSNCYVFTKEESFEGSNPEIERAAGTKSVMMGVSGLEGEEVIILLSGLKYDTKYYFAASCSD